MPSTLRAFLPTALALLAAAPALAQPRAVLPEPIRDFEVVAKGEVIRHDFVIRNEGDQPLEILEVRPACGCTVAEYDATIAPGASGKVHAEVETVTFAGPISKSIAVITNDPEQPKLQLVVKATVKPYIAVEPGYARFIYVQGEEAGTITQSVYSQDETDLDILKVEYPEDTLEVKIREAKTEEKRSTATRQWKVEVSIRPDAVVGALRDHVVLRVDHPKQKEVLIPISGFVRPRQHVTPFELDLGQLSSENFPYERRFDLTNFITNDIRVEKIVSDVPGIQAEATPNEKTPGHRFKVDVRFGPEMPKGPFETELEIHITDPKNPVVKLPIKGRVI